MFFGYDRQGWCFLKPVNVLAWNDSYVKVMGRWYFLPKGEESEYWCLFWKPGNEVIAWQLYYLESRRRGNNKLNMGVLGRENISQRSGQAKDRIKEASGGLPWWRSGWESACQCRGHGFEPWSGKIPHAVEQLGPWATITEPAHLEPVLRNKRGRDSERPMHRNEEWPPLAATRESPRTETKTQHSHK